MSAFTTLETAVVVEARKGANGGREFDLLVHKASLDIVILDSGQAELARSAWRKYGKGRHPVGLSIGGCCSYALARYTGEPLLCKGEYFARTDAHRVPPG